MNLSRKERERLQRRQDILNSAVRLFAEKGFTNTTLEDIATKSEFGIGTIYNYFQNKEEIFKSIIDGVLEANLEIVERVDQNTDNLIEFLEQFTRAIFEYLVSNKEALLLLVTYFIGNGERPIHLKNDAFETKHCKMDEIFRKRIVSGIEKQEIRKLNPDNLQHFYHTLVYPYVTGLIRSKEFKDSSINEHVDFILDILFNGILIR